MGSLGNVNPSTGQYDHGFERAWSGFSGKSPPTQPQLPQGFKWLGPELKKLFGEAAGNLSFDPSNTAQAVGTQATNQAGGLAGKAATGAGAAFGGGLGNLGEGLATGYMPNLDSIDALLRPGLDRSFERGSAAIREQNALTGNLSSSGASREIADYRGGLENNLNSNVANIYGQNIGQSMGIRSGLTQTALGLPGAVGSTLLNPLIGSGLQGQQFPAQLMGLSTGAIGGAPFFANQGSGGNGAVGSLLGAYMSGGMGGSGKGGGSSAGAGSGKGA